MKLTVATQN